MFCEKCGACLPNDAKFCDRCGESIHSDLKTVVKNHKGPKQKVGKKVKKKRALWIAFGVGVILVMLIVLGVALKLLFAEKEMVENTVKDEFVLGDNEVMKNEETDFFDTYEYGLESDDDIGQEIEMVDDMVEYNPSVVEEVEQDYLYQDYILPGSDTRYINSADLEGLTAYECRLARNEIYARKGRMFKDASLQAYFNSKSWYKGTILPDSFSESFLNQIEKANVKTITDYEARKGY